MPASARPESLFNRRASRFASTRQHRVGPDDADVGVVRLRRAELHLHDRTAASCSPSSPALSPVPVYVRTHNLLTSGDGTPALKWGSTNAYTRGRRAARPIYDWTIVDRILDTYVERRMKPLVEIGFMPEALSTHPEPVPARLEAGRDYNRDLHRLDAIRRTTTTSGASWSTSGRATRSSSTARRKSRAGSGRSGTSPTSATGTARRRNTRSCTTTPPTA